jgi:hypothetical protein
MASGGWLHRNCKNFGERVLSMSIVKFFAIIIIMLSLTIKLYAQDPYWLTIKGKDHKGKLRTVYIASNEKDFPLRELRFWVCTSPSYNEDLLNSDLVASRIRFKYYTGSYTVLSTYRWVYKDGKEEQEEILNSIFIKQWRDLLKESEISRMIWKYVYDYFDR